MLFRALLVLALGLASCADVDSPPKPAAPKSPEDAMRGTPTTPTRPDTAESTPMRTAAATLSPCISQASQSARRANEDLRRDCVCAMSISAFDCVCACAFAQILQ